jgi:UPF0755 protein
MKRIYIGVAFVLFVLAVSLIWWINGTSPANSTDHKPQIFTIEQGAGVRAIAKNLKNQGLIKDPVAFFLLTKKLGLDNKIQAGDYRLFPSMNGEQVAKELTHGTLDIWITVPEGQRAAEISETLKQKMPKYDPSWNAVLDQNEGYLFPDTYLFPKEADINIITSIMNNTFNKRYESLGASKSGYTKEQIVTIASLIEREARHDQDRPLVASVIYNRLNSGMSLDLDASIQYALGSQRKWWPTLPDSGSNVLPDSPYNTYTHAGLPPTPISNPGLAALQAAISPASTDYLYYITDKNGVNHYAKTLAQHEANISKYGL